MLQILSDSQEPTRLIQLKDEKGSSVIFIAVPSGNTEAARLSVERGADVNSTDAKDLSRPHNLNGGRALGSREDYRHHVQIRC